MIASALFFLPSSIRVIPLTSSHDLILRILELREASLV